jgi:hypothetical protein
MFKRKEDEVFQSFSEKVYKNNTIVRLFSKMAYIMVSGDIRGRA